MEKSYIIKNQFDRQKIEIFINVGDSIYDIMLREKIPEFLFPFMGVCFITENYEEADIIPIEKWKTTLITKNTNILIFENLMGKGGGGSKNVARLAATLVIVAASAYFAPSAAGLIGVSSEAGIAAVGAGLGMLGTAVVSMLIPPVSANLDGLSYGGIATSKYYLSSSSNQESLYGTLPRIYGKIKYYPYKAAKDYTETFNNNQYLRCLFTFGYGPLDISDIRIGNTPLSNFSDVQYEIRNGFDNDAPISLYTNTIRTDVYSKQLKQVDAPFIVQTRDNTEEITFDITFNRLVLYDTSGKQTETSVTMHYEYRAVDAPNWTSLGDITYTASETSAVVKSIRIPNLTKGKYEIKVTRITSDNTTNTSLFNDCYLTAVRSIEYVYPVKKTGLAMLALRIKATDQLNNTIDQLSATVQSYLNVYDRDTSSWNLELTEHPAWALYDLLTGTANPQPIDTSRVDLSSLLDWVDLYPSMKLDIAIDYDTTVFETAKNICSAGRSAFNIINGNYYVILDKPNKPIVASITPRNSWGFSASKSFYEDIHGFKVRYIDPERDWTQQVVIAYADGFNESNATKFMTLDAWGCADRTQAWKLGRYQLAQITLRPEKYIVNQDMENLRVNVGDKCILSYDVIKVGLGSARVKAITTYDSTIVSVTLDDYFILPIDNTYTMTVRSSLGVFTTYNVSASSSSTNVITLISPIPENSISFGDLVILGETEREFLDVLVTRIEPQTDLSAKLTFVDESPAIYTADSGVVPPYDPLITQTPVNALIKPNKPIVKNIVSDETVLTESPGGGWTSAIQITLEQTASDLLEKGSIQAIYRKVGAVEYTRELFPNVTNGKIYLTKVDEKYTYEIQLRYISNSGVASDWTVAPDTYVIGKTTPPPDIEFFDIQKNQLYWEYPNPPRDFYGYRVYFNYGTNTNKGNAVRAHTESVINNSAFPLNQLPKGELTIFIVAVDTSNIESVNPAEIFINNGTNEYDNILEDIDFDVLNFPGTIINGTIIDDKLKADGTTYFYKSSGENFYTNPTTNFYPDELYLQMSYEFEVPFDGSIENAFCSLNYDINGKYKIYYKRDGTGAFFPDDSDNFFPEDTENFFKGGSAWAMYAAALPIAYETIYFKVVTDAGDTQGVITNLNATIDAPDIIEVLNNVSISAVGTRLPITKTYKIINKVFLTLFSYGTGISAQVIDYDLTGPLVKVFDSSGTAVDGVVTADVRGYN